MKLNRREFLFGLGAQIAGQGGEGDKEVDERFTVIEKGMEGMQRSDAFHTDQIQSLNRRMHRVEMREPTQWYKYRGDKGGDA